MLVYVSLGAFAGIVVCGLLFIIMGLKGGPWKLPGIGMLVCFALVIVSAFLLVRGDTDTAADGNEGLSAAVLDLTGAWKQADSGSEDSYQEATIADGTIEIYWVSDGGDTKSLYWAGTYEAPTSAAEPYSWDSENDHDKTDAAILASGDDYKTFTYEDGKISYEASALGITTTVSLEKQ